MRLAQKEGLADFGVGDDVSSFVVLSFLLRYMRSLQAFGCVVALVPKSSRTSSVHVLLGNLRVFFVFCAEPFMKERMTFVVAVGSIPTNLLPRQTFAPDSQRRGEVKSQTTAHRGSRRNNEMQHSPSFLNEAHKTFTEATN